jgi:four helix bundle protein
MAGKDYKDLLVWQDAMDLVVLVYRVTTKFPHHELYGLTGQLRRSAVSVPSNIAEGQGRRTKRDFQNFLSIAHGSLRELETQVLIGQRLTYIDDNDVSQLLDLA